MRSTITLLSAIFLNSMGMAAETPARIPNIVYLYGDDIGYGDFGCYGATAVKTPNVDAVAAGGLRFTSAYASSATCTPSRFSLLTGKYAFRQQGTGILPGDAALIIQPGRVTLPGMLKQAGYTTGVVGKWHLGLGEKGKPIDWNGEIKPGPLEVGFDHSFIMAATGDRAPCVYLDGHHVVGLRDDDPLLVSYEKPFPGEPTGVTDREMLKMDWSQGHNQAVVNGIGRIGYMKGGKSALWQDDDMSKVFTRHAVEFIEREKDHPFFLYLATHDIHVPRVPNKDFVGKTTMGPRGDAIVEFDWIVGQVVATLEQHKLMDHTLVIISSDNGPVLDDGYKDDANEKLGAHKPAGPLRGGKYSAFEGGTRIPFITAWRGRIEPGVSDALISQVDALASLASLTGQTFSKMEAPDSQNVLPALLGDSPTGRESLVEHAKGLALRAGHWKFIRPGPIREGLGPWVHTRIAPPGLLFDLSNDPAEANDLSAKNPDKVKELARQLSKIQHSDAESD